MITQGHAEGFLAFGLLVVALMFVRAAVTDLWNIYRSRR